MKRFVIKRENNLMHIGNMRLKPEHETLVREQLDGYEVERFTR